MTFAIHGLAVAPGIAIGRAVIAVSSRMEVVHYFIEPEQVRAEIIRVRDGRDAVVEELRHMQEVLPADAPQELAALLDVHLMLLQDEILETGVKRWISERLYNAEWALTTQLELVSRQFDEMEDEYLRERKADLAQIVERVLRYMRGVAGPVAAPPACGRRSAGGQASLGDEFGDEPLVLVANDLSPADMLQFKSSVFAGFITDVGGKTSHTAIVARSMDIPAVVGARSASHLVRQDDWVVIDGDAGVVIVNPSPIILEEYGFRQRQVSLERERLSRLRHTPAVTLDGQTIELLANIERPSDCEPALRGGAAGVGLFRTEFLFMGRTGKLPDEDEQYASYREVLEGMKGAPVTIRTIDIGADKPLDKLHRESTALNPALGLRAIRWSLADTTMFRTQLRAILRAALYGPVNLLFPMLCSISEIQQTLAQVELARAELNARNTPFGELKLGAMIEVPAAALMVRSFLKYFDFLSIGTNDLVQYTLAIDRADEAVAHLYDPMNPAVLRLVADVIAAANAAGKEVSVCGEMGGDVSMTKLLLGFGLRSFSMHPAQILAIKQEILRTDTRKLVEWSRQVLEMDEPTLNPIAA